MRGFILFVFMAIILIGLHSCLPDAKKPACFCLSRYPAKDTIIEGIQMVYVPAGPFTYGYKNMVTYIPHPYYIAKYEITCAQYYRYIQQMLQQGKVHITDGKIYQPITGYSDWKDSTYYLKILDTAIYYANGQLHLNPVYANHPVTSINWLGCMEFCRHYGLTLPTRYEWEKAARGCTGHLFPWGDDIDCTRANYYNSYDPYEPGTTPVGFYNGQTHLGFKTTNSPSPYGCYDMAGNAWEYTLDYYCLRTGGGGGYMYHTAGMISAPYQNCYGLPYPHNFERCDSADGFRVAYILKPSKHD